MSIVVRTSKTEPDNLPRTDWFSPEVLPTIAGPYEARTGGGHVFTREWTGTHWLNAITGLKSTAQLEWRGVKPGMIEIGRYPAAIRDELRLGLAALYEQATPPEHRSGPSLIEQHEITGLPFA